MLNLNDRSLNNSHWSDDMVAINFTFFSINKNFPLLNQDHFLHIHECVSRIALNSIFFSKSHLLG